MKKISGQIRHLYVTWCQNTGPNYYLWAPKQLVLLKSQMYCCNDYGAKMCLEDFSGTKEVRGVGGVGGEYPHFFQSPPQKKKILSEVIPRKMGILQFAVQSGHIWDYFLI